MNDVAPPRIDVNDVADRMERGGGDMAQGEADMEAIIQTKQVRALAAELRRRRLAKEARGE